MVSLLAALRTQQASVDLSGKVAVVVGGTSGIGEGIAHRLAEAKARVLVVGRSEERGAAVVAECVKRGAGPGSAFIPCDAFLLSNVKQTCANLTSKLAGTTTCDAGSSSAPVGRLDYLILTQGMATLQGRTETKEGLDQKLALHYYSRMAFIQCLAPALQQSKDPRVLSVLSAGVHGTYARYKEDPDVKQSYSLKAAADVAGFYNDLAADFMSEMHAPIKFVHAAPGFVATSWGTEMPWAVRGLVRLLQKVAKSQADCAEFMCSAIFSQELLAGKRYFLMKEDGTQAKLTALHDEAKEAIRVHTLEILNKLMK